MNNKINIPKAFIGFLVASFLIWALINLSKEYTSKVSYVVNYQELPQNKLLQLEPQKEIVLLLKGTGFNLLSSKISNKSIFLKTDKLSQKSDTKFYFLPNEQKISLQEQLSKGLQIEGILQDTIYLNIGSLASKKVPVIAKTNLQFNAGYALSESIKIKPDSITISGDSQQINDIQNITTKYLNVENIIDDFSKEVSVEIPENLNNIKISHQIITISGVVDKFTEGEFEIPVTLENIPFGTEVNVFPKKVKVTYKVGLKDFGKVTEDSFEVVCDFKQVEDNKVNYLLPRVKTKPALVSSVKITPDKIEYLIHK